MKIAFVFPGQGSQVPNLFENLPNEKVVIETIEEASDILKEDVRLLQKEEALESTRNVQISLFVSGMSVYKYFKENGYMPDYVAGHSVGAFAAASVSGVLSFEEALRMVALRGKLMEGVHPTGYGMIVVLGMDHIRLQEILDEHFTEENPIYLANINSPTQITVSGSLNGLEKVIETARNSGANCANFLEVNTPSHCPLLKPVSKELEHALDKVLVNDPSIDYVSNYHARVLYRKEDIVNDLYESVASPVQWDNVTSILYENNVRYFQEFPPGNVLTKLLLKKYNDIRALSLSESKIDDCLYIMDKIRSEE